MSFDYFFTQMTRLTKVFGEKSYASERTDIIWNGVRDLSDSWFQKTVTALIASSKYPPLPADILELARIEKNQKYTTGLPTHESQIHPSENSMFSKSDIAEMFSMMKKRLNGEISYAELDAYGKMISNAVNGHGKDEGPDAA